MKRLVLIFKLSFPAVVTLQVDFIASSSYVQYSVIVNVQIVGEIRPCGSSNFKRILSALISPLSRIHRKFETAAGLDSHSLTLCSLPLHLANYVII